MAFPEWEENIMPAWRQEWSMVVCVLLSLQSFRSEGELKIRAPGRNGEVS